MKNLNLNKKILYAQNSLKKCKKQDSLDKCKKELDNYKLQLDNLDKNMKNFVPTNTIEWLKSYYPKLNKIIVNKNIFNEKLLKLFENFCEETNVIIQYI